MRRRRRASEPTLPSRNCTATARAVVALTGSAAVTMIGKIGTAMTATTTIGVATIIADADTVRTEMPMTTLKGTKIKTTNSKKVNR